MTPFVSNSGGGYGYVMVCTSGMISLAVYNNRAHDCDGSVAGSDYVVVVWCSWRCRRAREMVPRCESSHTSALIIPSRPATMAMPMMRPHSLLRGMRCEVRLNQP